MDTTDQEDGSGSEAPESVKLLSDADTEAEELRLQAEAAPRTKLFVKLLGDGVLRGKRYLFPVPVPRGKVIDAQVAFENAEYARYSLSRVESVRTVSNNDRFGPGIFVMPYDTHKKGKRVILKVFYT